MSFLQVRNISKVEDGNTILQDIEFTQNKHQKLAIAGTTGSGKTTLLKIIGGHVQADSGNVFFNAEKLKGPEEKLMPGHPKIAYLSQHFELRNHYKVEELLEMSNKLSNNEANFIYSICRIDHLLKRWTHKGLSGGERQRISLAMMLVTAPELLLLDEPFSNLDAIHKNILKDVINNISNTLNITCMLVSHDPVDVLSWADEIIVLQNGKMIQKDAPQKLYHNPINEYAAALFGKYNILTPSLARTFANHTDVEIGRINSYIRPGMFVININNGVKATVNKANFNGGYNEVELTINNHKIIAHSSKMFQQGTEVFVSLQFNDL